MKKKRTLEKKHSPEVNSNNNEEHITNPCGFVTHIEKTFKKISNIRYNMNYKKKKRKIGFRENCNNAPYKKSSKTVSCRLDTDTHTHTHTHTHTNT